VTTLSGIKANKYVIMASCHDPGAQCSKRCLCAGRRGIASPGGGVRGYLGGCPTVAGERHPDLPRQGRVGAAWRPGDGGGGANVRQRRLVEEEVASGGGGRQICRSRDVWGWRGH
jgi:hypothetical protein